MMTRMARVLLADVVTEPIYARDVAALVTCAEAGAVVTFSGDVRDHDHGRHVARLEYEGHPSAAAVLAECAAEIATEHPVVAVAAVHRVGPLEIGDAALVVAVSSAHRAEAFAACADLVEIIKERLPVWKHQVFTDGSDEWVNCA